MGLTEKAVSSLIKQVTLPGVFIKQSLCTPMRFVRSECNFCIQVCPRNAIIKERFKIEIDNNCDDCGICMSVCPNGAIEFRDKRDILEDALSGIHKQTKTILINCEKYTGPQIKNSVTVSCMGAIHEVSLLNLLDRFSDVILMLPECGKCERIRGMKYFKNRIDSAKSILNATRQNDEKIKIIASKNVNKFLNVAPEDSPGEGIERRAFFSYIAKKTVSALDSARTNPEQGETERRGKNHFRARLIKYLESSKSLDKESKFSARFNAGVILVDSSKCFGCNVCEHVCPTGAIRKEENQETFRLFFDSRWCTACNACVGACLVKAIELDSKINPWNLLEIHEETLVELQGVKCENCGMPFFTNKELMCPRCKKIDSFKEGLL